MPAIISALCTAYVHTYIGVDREPKRTAFYATYVAAIGATVIFADFGAFRSAL
jgi:hypothetical protein